MRDASDDEGEKESTPTRTSGGRDRDYDTTSSRPSHHPDRQPYRPGQMIEAGGGRGGRGVAPFAGGTRGLAGTAGGTGASRGGGAQARLMGQRQAPLMRQEPTPASRTAGQSSASKQTFKEGNVFN